MKNALTTFWDPRKTRPIIKSILKRESSTANVVLRYSPGGYHPANIGDRFHDRYVVLRKLGFGRYSTVWLAKDESQQRHVALKILTADALIGEKHIDELRNLQRTTSADSGHPGYSRVVQLLDHFEHHGPHGLHLCLTLELLGPNLSDVQWFYKQHQRAFPSRILKRVIKQILLGLDYLHRSCGVVHTDLQPNTISIEFNDFNSAVTYLINQTPKVTETTTLPKNEDFGIIECSQLPIQIPALVEDWKVKSKITDLSMGNFLHDPWLTLIQPELLRAPEVILGCKWDCSADIWSLGCIVFELLSGGVPLFNPLSSEERTPENHLRGMVNLSGDIPKEMVAQGKNSEIYFDRQGRFRNGDAYPRGTSLQRIFEGLKKKSKSKTWVDIDLPFRDIPVVDDLLHRMLEISPTRRATAEELLQHRWFQDI